MQEEQKSAGGFICFSSATTATDRHTPTSVEALVSPIGNGSHHHRNDAILRRRSTNHPSVACCGECHTGIHVLSILPASLHTNMIIEARQLRPAAVAATCQGFSNMHERFKSKKKIMAE